MREKEIKKYISRLNQNKGSESIFTRKISENVVISKVWAKQPKISDIVSGGDYSRFNYRFFFIKNECEKYIGAVLDMEHDLHWYIHKDYRKKGYLTKALKGSIIPYLFYEERKAQRITIEKERGEENYINSKNVALNLGFKPTNIDETEFNLDKNDFNWEFENLNEIDGGLTKERLNILIKRVNYAYKLILKTSDELYLSFNNDKDLSVVAKDLSKYDWKMEDLYYESKKTKG